MPTTSFARGRLHVTHEPTVDVHSTRIVRERDMDGTVDVTPELLDALAGNDFGIVDHLAVAPRDSRDVTRAPTPVDIELDLHEDEDAVVLVEEDGVYSWHLPAADRRPRELGGPHAARFHIDVRRARATVLSFAAPPLGALPITLLESHVHTGLVHIPEPDPLTWRPIGGLADLGLPTDRATRVMLFVHGTFDSTVGAFAALGLSADGTDLLTEALRDYDAVVGFDHRTLSVDPREDATGAGPLLTAAPSTRPMTVDIVCHSRGGLTARSLVEEVLPTLAWRGRVDRVVFVAATNAGTHFADASRWGDLVDMYTNLIAARTRVVSGMPGGRLVLAAVTAGVRTVGSLVRWLAAYATDSKDVPGIAAMVPDGAFVTEINEDQQGAPRPGTPWFVVSSNFHVTEADRPLEIPKVLALRLAEGLVDDVFHGDNDLVVDVASMSAINLPVGGGYVRDEMALGTNSKVYHTNYFTDGTVVWALSGWLIARVDHVGGRGDGGGDRGGGGVEAEPPEELAPPPPPSVAPPPPPTHQRGPEPDVEPTDTVSSTFMAELPARPPVGVPVTLRVRLSRGDLQAALDAVAARTVLAVAPGTAVDIQVIPTTNLVLGGPDLDSMLLPPGSGFSELQFSVTAVAPGQVKAKILARQGKTLLGSVVVEAVAVDPSDVSGGEHALTRAQVEMASATSVELADVAWLEIAQLDRGGQTVFQYELRLPTTAAPVGRIVGISKPIKDPDGFVSDLFREVQALWFDNSDKPKKYLASLQDLGASLFEQLFPQDLQAVLWEHRDDLDNLFLLADEPFIPWELVHLKPPVGPRQKEARFLGQLGLVRWQFMPFPAQPALQARKGRVFAVCPDYVDETLALDEVRREAEFLTSTLGATPVPATEESVRELLRRRDGLDVLHFSGHGAADPRDIRDARILLAGRKVGDALVSDYLSSTTVAQNARLARKDGVGPLVVLNACQVGRSGEELTTLGGFARAFLEAGASAFVSCLWSVNQVPARIFVETFYGRLLEGDTVAAAALAARGAARSEGDATWLAYVVYARPDAVLAHPG